jgi:NAD+ synthase (glutamine-hydrolysing)
MTSCGVLIQKRSRPAGLIRWNERRHTEENMAARIRCFLMALSISSGGIDATTGETDDAGYYAFMAIWRAVSAGQVAPADLRFSSMAPTPTLTWTGSNRSPSALCATSGAELRADQTDQDSLPPYEEMDAILNRYGE